MKKQSAVESLKESIRILEIRQADEGTALKEQFKITYESLRPVNLIKSTISDLTNSAELKINFVESFISILTGYLSKKFIAGPKSNPILKIVGALVQFGVTSIVARNAETIRGYISDLIDKIFHTHNEEESEKKL
jgi:hypothetical protein